MKLLSQAELDSKLLQNIRIKNRHKIIEQYNNDSSFSNFVKTKCPGRTFEEKLYCYAYRCSPIDFICEVCKNKYCSFKNIKLGYNKHCSKRCFELKQSLNKNQIPFDQIENYKTYSKLVRKITELQNLSLLENNDKRGSLYHLDHKFSIFEGFKNSIPPYIIGNICNLEILPIEENLKKNKKCSITKEQLFKSFLQ